MERTANIGKDLIQELISMPCYIKHEGVTFRKKVIFNGSNEMRLCYDIENVDTDSPHNNEYWKLWNGWLNKPFYPSSDPEDQDGHFCSWLVLIEGIENESDMHQAILNTRLFFTKIISDYATTTTDAG